MERTWLRGVALCASVALTIALTFVPSASRGLQAELFALLASSLLVGLASLRSQQRMAPQRE